jgi:hypothetical protein
LLREVPECDDCDGRDGADCRCVPDPACDGRGAWRNCGCRDGTERAAERPDVDGANDDRVCVCGTYAGRLIVDGTDDDRVCACGTYVDRLLVDGATKDCRICGVCRAPR